MLIKRQINIPKNHHFFLFGPRQVGKSTLLKSEFVNEPHLYYDLLHSEVYRKFYATPEYLRLEVESAVKKNNITHIIIDEIQKIPQLLDEIHSLIVSGLPCYFICSGSSARKLKRMHANMLGGRAWTLHLYPFNYFEIKKDLEFNTILRYGTIPTVFLSKDNTERNEILRSYVDTYLKEEVELEAGIRNLGGFLRFLPIASAQNGEITNFANIARETGVKYHVVKEYYKILEDTLIGFFLLPYSRSIRKKMVRHPKFYFFDTGIVSALNMRLTVPMQSHDPEYGKIFEHFILLELIKLNVYKRADLKFSFYRTEKGAEVDCIIEFPSHKIIALEIKSIKNPAPVHLSGLYSFHEIVPEAELILTCCTDKPLKINNVSILPWNELLEYINSMI